MTEKEREILGENDEKWNTSGAGDKEEKAVFEWNYNKKGWMVTSDKR